MSLNSFTSVIVDLYQEEVAVDRDRMGSEVLKDCGL